MHKQFAKWFPASVLALSLCSPAALAGFSVQGGKLVEGNGVPFVMRGVNHAHVWYKDTTPQALRDIAATGSNTVRIVLANGTGGLGGRVGGAEVAQVIQWCKDNKLIAVLEVHDATGYGDGGNAENPLNTVNYWLSSDIRSALNNQEDYVIINIANEPLGNNRAGEWISLQTQSIQRMRQAGIKHTIMVDAPNWGQDWSNTMRNNATTVFNADSERNTVFSVHMYESYGNSSAVQSYLQDFKNKNLPVVVGEFGADHKGANVDEDAIMAVSQQLGFGYLGWSWSGNNAETKSLDIVNNFNVNSLSSWGNRLINGTNGIKQTSKLATIFGGQSSSSSASSTVPNIAFGKPASASSFEGAGYEAAKAFDNNGATRWASALTAGTASLSVDLGAYYDITGLRLSWEAAYASGYNIQISSDNVNWTNLFSKTNGSGGVENISITGQGRYLRINMTTKANPAWGYSLWDIAIFGTGANGFSSSAPSSISSSKSSSSSSITNATGRLVSQNGRLRTLNGRLVNERGQAFQLRGMSTHGLHWYPQFVNSSSFKWLRDDWNSNVVRLAMYTKEGGYLDNPAVLDTLWKGIDAAIANDLYVIVDWHILSDGNPLTHKEQAKTFFQRVTAKYGNIPNIIYEIANEPNGVDWESSIKPYANEVIPVIRAGAPDAFVIVGTAVWSQRLDQVVASPLTFNNVAYALHFYACSPEHQEPLRAIVRAAADAKLPIVSTEWGNSEYTGNGSICPDQTNIWLNLLDSYGISWVNWSLSDKNETSAALRAGASGTGGWSSAQLSDSGNFVRNRLRSYGVNVPSSSSSSSISSSLPPSSSSSSIISTSPLTCVVTQTGSWQGGYQLDVKVTNTGAAVQNWTVYLNYPQTAAITNSWNATLTGSGTNRVTATNVSYNGNLGSGASTTFGLTGNTSGALILPSCSGQPVVVTSSSGPSSSVAPSSRSSVVPSSSGVTTTSSSIPSTSSSIAPSSRSSSSVSSVAPGVRLDNPFVGAQWYRDPVWSDKAQAEPGGSKISGYNTAVWMDRIGAIAPTDGSWGLRDHLDAALDQNANVIQVVVYDLPNRDCHALASNGELRQGAEGSNRYRTEYIDALAAIFADPKYRDLRIIAIIEPDSLPNLVTNLSTPACQQAADATHGYVANTRYTLSKLYAIPNVYSYVDIGHSGWLGWSENFGKAVTLIGDAIKGATGGVNSIAGFVSNTSGYTPLYEPFLDSLANSTFPGGSSQTRQAKFYEWNPHFSEVSFVQAWRSAMISAGFPSSIGMLVDTSRNGWGGTNRPIARSTSSVLDTFVDQSRIDRRAHRGNWCNQPGGVGERPQVAPLAGIDAYVWVKPPGESDGAASLALSYDPQDPAKGFDRNCDPTFTNAAGTTTGALANAPVAGRWFKEGFQVLLKNAYPPL
ncbi:cellulase family glycosylhydrolase [Cellvibrio sp. UBA7671]|uniref:cellulase family glycosylhydrolase n=1 Tax=Cellvibrio sp. UBA7671 TaxID=1946312 RepID=UPI002F3526F3